jgi:ABC-type phosphate transport system, ATPase component
MDLCQEKNITDKQFFNKYSNMTEMNDKKDDSILSIERLSIRYSDDKLAVKDVSAKVKKKTITAIMLIDKICSIRLDKRESWSRQICKYLSRFALSSPCLKLSNVSAAE